MSSIEFFHGRFLGSIAPFRPALARSWRLTLRVALTGYGLRLIRNARAYPSPRRTSLYMIQVERSEGKLDGDLLAPPVEHQPRRFHSTRVFPNLRIRPFFPVLVRVSVHSVGADTSLYGSTPFLVCTCYSAHLYPRLVCGCRVVCGGSHIAFVGRSLHIVATLNELSYGDAHEEYNSCVSLLGRQWVIYIRGISL